MLFVAVQITDRRHFLIRKRKSEQIQIFFDMLRIGGARDHHDAPLQIPAEDDLSRGYAMACRTPSPTASSL